MPNSMKNACLVVVIIRYSTPDKRVCLRDTKRTLAYIVAFQVAAPGAESAVYDCLHFTSLQNTNAVVYNMQLTTVWQVALTTAPYKKKERTCENKIKYR